MKCLIPDEGFSDPKIISARDTRSQDIIHNWSFIYGLALLPFGDNCFTQSDRKSSMKDFPLVYEGLILFHRTEMREVERRFTKP